MVKFLEKNCGVILFYGILIVGVVMLNFRFSVLNNENIGKDNVNVIALNK